MHAPSSDATYERPRARRSATGSLFSGPRARPLLLGLAGLLLLVVVFAVWYGDPTNRARRELSQANERILERQRAVDDARRLLEQRLAELRAARAEADVQATVYRGVLEREGRAEVVDSQVVGGEVLLPQLPATP